MIIELRQYTLHPGRRDELIELFDREFVESQEACGMRILGQFRDLDDPDRFVWLRGFDNMQSRLKALTEFYSGPIGKANSAKANATMVDVSDVLLLRPVTALAASAGGSPDPAFLVTVYSRDEPFDESFLGEFNRWVRPLLPSEPLACLQTEHSENNFPALPVRTGENVFVFLTRFDSVSQLDDWKHPDTIPLARHEIRLTPTAGSRLH